MQTEENTDAWSSSSLRSFLLFSNKDKIPGKRYHPIFYQRQHRSKEIKRKTNRSAFCRCRCDQIHEVEFFHPSLVMVSGAQGQWLRSGLEEGRAAPGGAPAAARLS